MENKDFIPYHIDQYSDEEMINRSQSFYEWLNKRRSVRDFSSDPIPKSVINNIILAGSTAPSGANKQPWTFCVVSSQEMKEQIRIAAEKEEQENYNGRMSERWLKDLEHLATNEVKEFLTAAPHLIIVFKRAHETEEGKKINNYYVNESVGLAAGFLLTAIYNAGLVSVTHTPSPMNFLAKLLGRPDNERPFLLIPVGKPVLGVEVPNICRKPIDEVAVYY
jgi:iodotyrosine deiodinase